MGNEELGWPLECAEDRGSSNRVNSDTSGDGGCLECVLITLAVIPFAALFWYSLYSWAFGCPEHVKKIWAWVVSNPTSFFLGVVSVIGGLMLLDFLVSMLIEVPRYMFRWRRDSAAKPLSNWRFIKRRARWWIYRRLHVFSIN